jgi:hypothetical protein
VNGRILRIEVRRSIALWAGGVFLLTALAFLYLLGGPWWQYDLAWTSQWSTAAQWERYLLSFLLPLAAGAGALQGLRDHRAGTGELLTATPRPAWQRAAVTAGALAATLAGAYLLVFGVAAVQVAAGGALFHPGWIPVVGVGALGLVAVGWLGMGIGRTLPSVLTPPAVAIATLMVMYLVGGTWARDEHVPLTYLAPPLNHVRSAFHDIAGQVSLAQALGLLGLAATGFWLLAAASVRARLPALLPVALGVTVALPMLPSDPARFLVVNEAAAAPVCSGRVCVTKLHEDWLATLAGPGEEALRLLARLPDPPVSIRESTAPDAVRHAPERDARVLLVDFGNRDVRDVTGDELTRGLLAGAGTPSCGGVATGDFDDRNRELAARTVAAGWLMGDLAPLPGTPPGLPELDALVEPAWEALHALPEDRQRARVAALRAAALSCDADLLDVLTGARR